MREEVFEPAEFALQLQRFLQNLNQLVPGGSIIAMVPVLTSVGLPIEGIGILLGVDTIPDMFRTTANVTGQLAAATIVSRGAPRAERLEPAPSNA